MIPGWTLHQVYEGLRGQPRAMLIDPAGRVHHVDVEGTNAQPTREAVELALSLLGQASVTSSLEIAMQATDKAKEVLRASLK